MAQVHQIEVARPDLAPPRGPGQVKLLWARIAQMAAQTGKDGISAIYFGNLGHRTNVQQELQFRIPLGKTRLDRLLGGGLKRGTLTEILSRSPGDVAAATGFLLSLAIRLAGPRESAAIFWIYEDFSHREQGAPYAPGLALFGLDPARLVLVAAPSAKEALWAMEEALKSAAPAVVIGELWSAKPYDLTASRRLLLAAQRRGTPALLSLAGLAGGADLLSSGADLRFEIRAQQSRYPPSAGGLPLPGAPLWSVRIAKARAGPGSFGIDREKFHRVFWDHEEALFRDALPLALPPVSRHRSDHPAFA